MISSLLHRLNLAEQTLNANAQLLSELQLLEFEAEPCPRDAQRGKDLDTLSDFLRRLEPRLGQSTNRLHLLTDAVSSQRAQLADINTLSGTLLPNWANPVDTQTPGGDPSLDAFPPDEAQPRRNFVQRGSLPSRRNSTTDNLSPSSECVIADSQCCHLANQLKNMNLASIDGGSQYGCAGLGEMASAAGDDRDAGSSAGLGVDATDVVVEMLEAEVEKQERVIHRMMRCNETLANKEQEYERKNEWYEHKMRLLKQDKRKRGETIGKLLRCIDDMRETVGTTDDTHDYTVSDDRGLDPGTVGIGRGMRLEARGGGGAWAEDDFRDAFQELQDEHRVRLREKVSMETCRSNDHGLGLDDDKSRLGSGSDDDRSRFDLRFEEDRNRLGFDHQQKPTDFAVRHFPLLLTRSTGRELLPPLGQDTNSRNRKEVSSDQFPFSQ